MILAVKRDMETFLTCGIAMHLRLNWVHHACIAHVSVASQGRIQLLCKVGVHIE